MSLLARKRERLLDRFPNWDPFEFWVPSFKLADAGPSVTTEIDEESYTFKFETPGYKKEDIKVWMDGRVLKAEGSKAKGSASFSKSYWLKEGIKPEDLEASYQDGILSIKVPKLDGRSKKLEIEIH